MIRKNHSQVAPIKNTQPVNTSPSNSKKIQLSYSTIYFIVVVLMAWTFFTGYLFAQVNQSKNINAQTNENVPNPPSEVVQNSPEPQNDLSQVPSIQKDDYVRGDRDADVVLIEYSDYECPFCKRFDGTMKQVVKDYGKKIAWVYRHYPLAFHAKAQKSAEAAECAGVIGGNTAFWKMSDAIFAAMPDLELSDLPNMAQKIGLNKNKFTSCLDSGKYQDKISQQLKDASAAGVSGTPGTIIIGKNGNRDFIGGAYPLDQVKAKIDAILN